jgi:hypothetical protein
MRLSHSAAWISGFVWLIAACWGATFVYPYTHRLGLHDRFPLNFWMTFVAIQFLIIPVHELGHALGTWAVGYRLKVISVGPVAIVRDGRGINGGDSTGGLFGSVVSSGRFPIPAAAPACA